jgi:hypothetical protein
MSNFDTQPKGLQLSDLCRMGVMDDNETFVSNQKPLKFGARAKSPDANNYNTEDNNENFDPNKLNVFQEGLKKSKKRKKKRSGSKMDRQITDDSVHKSPDRNKLMNFITGNSQSKSPMRPKSQMLHTEEIGNEKDKDSIYIKHYETENNKYLKARKSPNIRLNAAIRLRSPLTEIPDLRTMNTVQTVNGDLDRPKLLKKNKSHTSLMHLLQKQTDLNEELMEENEKFSKDQTSLLRLLSQKDNQLKEVELMKGK